MGLTTAVMVVDRNYKRKRRGEKLEKRIPEGAVTEGTKMSGTERMGGETSARTFDGGCLFHHWLPQMTRGSHAGVLRRS